MRVVSYNHLRFTASAGGEHEPGGGKAGSHPPSATTVRVPHSQTLRLAREPAMVVVVRVVQVVVIVVVAAMVAVPVSIATASRSLGLLHLSGFTTGAFLGRTASKLWCLRRLRRGPRRRLDGVPSDGGPHEGAEVAQEEHELDAHG